jgi:hypothetical protein
VDKSVDDEPKLPPEFAPERTGEPNGHKLDNFAIPLLVNTLAKKISRAPKPPRAPDTKLTQLVRAVN